MSCRIGGPPPGVTPPTGSYVPTNVYVCNTTPYTATVVWTKTFPLTTDKLDFVDWVEKHDKTGGVYSLVAGIATLGILTAFQSILWWQSDKPVLPGTDQNKQVASAAQVSVFPVPTFVPPAKTVIGQSTYGNVPDIFTEAEIGLTISSGDTATAYIYMDWSKTYIDCWIPVPFNIGGTPYATMVHVLSSENMPDFTSLTGTINTQKCVLFTIMPYTS